MGGEISWLKHLSDAGLQDYAAILQLQEKLFNENIAAKSATLSTKNYMIAVEHAAVFTLGKSGKKENLLVSPEKIGVDFFHTSRGGDITFHGPGQWTIYPIIDLETIQCSIKDFVFGLEEVVIRLIADFGLKGFRIATASGVWIDDGIMVKKICAIGLKVSRHITMHGIAININTDMTYFGFIVPCGITDKGVTSLQAATKKTIDMQAVLDLFMQHFSNYFSVKINF